MLDSSQSRPPILIFEDADTGMPVLVVDADRSVRIPISAPIPPTALG